MRPLLSTLLLCAACARPAAPHPTSPPRPELALDGATLRVYRNDELQLAARAQHLELMRSSGALTATSVHFDFLTDGMALDAPRLSGNLGTEAFDVEGGVALHATDGSLNGNAPSAHFEAKEGAHGVATGAQSVQLAGVRDNRQFSLSAQRFRFEVAEQHFTFEPAQTRVGPR